MKCNKIKLFYYVMAIEITHRAYNQYHDVLFCYLLQLQAFIYVSLRWTLQQKKKKNRNENHM